MAGSRPTVQQRVMGIMTESKGWAPRALKVKFPDDDPLYGGLWLRMRRLTIGEVLERNELRAELLADEPHPPAPDAPVDELLQYSRDLARHNIESTRRLAQDLAGHTIAWNVCRVEYGPDGEEAMLPVEPTVEGFLAQPEGFLAAVARAWQQEIAEVPDPLSRNSGGGTPSPTEAAEVLSLPMETSTPVPSS